MHVILQGWLLHTSKPYWQKFGVLALLSCTQNLLSQYLLSILKELAIMGARCVCVQLVQQ